MKKLLAIIAIIILSSKLATASVTVINGLTHFYSGNSGDIISGEVILFNSSVIDQRVTFSINEALFSCNANRKFTEKAPHAQSSSDWFESEVMEKVLAPNEKYTYRYTIRIPADQKLKGSYWSVLMVYVENPVKKEQLTNNIGLDTKVRYAIGLLTHVNGFDDVNIDFTNVNFNQTEDTPNKLEINVKNDGSFIEGVLLTLEVYDATGNKISVFETDRNMVFPGVCKTYVVDISSLPPGDYQCLLLAEAREDFTGTNLSLNLK
ncbi:hypothetical protein [uncultured Roseivirga sp.]|uniref:hypothetical protein n=1 Tax=uncultured Roseivirga sp. TaxID=543088 RepID=UPI0030D93E5C|tara:strand:+ start:2783 stop:3571 length:789 start_codon:yes stop_codon:yes gene_type:complete